jgi:hypothetical protein
LPVGERRDQVIAAACDEVAPEDERLRLEQARSLKPRVSTIVAATRPRSARAATTAAARSAAAAAATAHSTSPSHAAAHSSGPASPAGSAAAVRAAGDASHGHDELRQAVDGIYAPVKLVMWRDCG